MNSQEKYEVVVGLEVHAQLQTRSKLFCGDSIAYGAEPNTQVSPITLGHPGTLPKMNKKAVEFAIKMGLACHCNIQKENYFARKNYFYPDLPKGYQISQHTIPICKNGHVLIQTDDGEKKIRLNRIHMEEDAGKSIHDIEETETCIDLNRAGTPLIEIVTEPDIRSGDEAFAYLTEIRKLVRYLEICDGNMEEGSLRCDANISVRIKGEEKLGTKVEVKNLNSIRNVKKAIEVESERLIELIEKGEPVIQQTRSFDAGNGTTFAIREKEDADDYRYFADPDLAPFNLKDEFIESIKSSIPVLQKERIRRYKEELSLPEYDANLLTEDKTFSDYFEYIIKDTVHYKAAANWMLGPVKTWLNDNNKDISSFPVLPERLAELINMVDAGELSFSVASGVVLQQMLSDNNKGPREIAVEKNLFQQSDANAIEPIIDAVLAKMADKVSAYKKGKKGLLSLFVGEVMKQSKGKADPKLVNKLLLEKLQSS
ncbi:MAG TPA: Asp-tRNA(Asn)/Glu-tRNA(Gln) amidotransferase subunit GatB [Chitinophagaceae bacterium]|nr:Asp-tRNA(Asn)/Glu-tRNA(Gln) amidotransferase subunit GatB [Chitinophagaceae bacterium]MCB9055360.1 Asp-tRNA(Asn)/Glu-tRNA(Gln) amidotransferase subunit GatB [Chitinophagales bacterium]HPG11544.1 Asp-tRNA(Asn)/Glu-tRNA(Gln) amidotransferase subunit GatB [Chitinophagaceae bacterium]HRX93246.1 Asp-tRNA(Asn)/Glu-tRNA(Gln) amidotransferase subunit GatB [Chitinophagaceae bacterium]